MEKFVENPPRTEKELLDVLQDTWNTYEQWFQVSAYTEEEGQEHHRWFKSHWDPIMLSLYKKYTDIIMGSYWCIVRLPRIEEEEEDDDEKLPSPILSPSSEEDEYLEYLEHRNNGDEPAYIPKPKPHLFF